MKATVTVSGYNRPAYLTQTLSALRSCEGIADATVLVLLDQCEETAAQQAIAARYGFEAGVYRERVGCNAAIRNAMAYGFVHMGSEYHLHLEDDCVPTRDALRWFAWAGKTYRDDPAVLNVSGYQRLSNGCLDECGLRRWFTPWGWATWRDRWSDLSAGWVPDDSISWDVIVNHHIRAGRYEAFPTVSRIQNVGAEQGTHVPDAEWHAANHHVPVTADHIEAEWPTDWGEVRRADYADHA